MPVNAESTKVNSQQRTSLGSKIARLFILRMVGVVFMEYIWHTKEYYSGIRRQYNIICVSLLFPSPPSSNIEILQEDILSRSFISKALSTSQAGCHGNNTLSNPVTGLKSTQNCVGARATLSPQLCNAVRTAFDFKGGSDVYIFLMYTFAVK